MAGKVEYKKIRGIWKWELLLALVIGLSDEDNSVSWTDNFVNVNVFNKCYTSSCTLLPLRFALFLNNASGL